MNSWIARRQRGGRWRVLAGSSLAAGLLAAGTAAGADAPINKLRVPLEHHPDGRVKTQITAGTATVAENGSINAKGVRIEMFAPDGALTGLAEADSCTVDREKGIVQSESRVRVVQRGVSISGDGFRWQATDQTIKILQNARVVFIREQAGAFFKLP